LLSFWRETEDPHRKAKQVASPTSPQSENFRSAERSNSTPLVCEQLDSNHAGKQPGPFIFSSLRLLMLGGEFGRFEAQIGGVIGHFGEGNVSDRVRVILPRRRGLHRNAFPKASSPRKVDQLASPIFVDMREPKEVQERLR
jgi:hypothetical protein